MTDSPLVAARAGEQMAAKTNECPCVAELIGYALGQAGIDDRLRIEAHLHRTGCQPCRSWLEKASHFRAEPWPDAASRYAGPPPTFVLANSPPPVSTQTPIPESSKWQREAFRDLEGRLQSLEEC